MRIIDTKERQGVERLGHFGGLTTVDVIGLDNAEHFSIQVSRGPVNRGAYMHSHKASEQLFFVFKGKLTMRADDDQSVVLGPGMAAYFAPGETHPTENEGREEVLSLVITSPPLK